MRALEGGGAVASARRSLIRDSVAVVSRIASSTSRRIRLSSTPPARFGGTRLAVSRRSAKKRYPASVGSRPAEVWGWVR